jgi:hypothetical protein
VLGCGTNPNGGGDEAGVSFVARLLSAGAGGQTCVVIRELWEGKLVENKFGIFFFETITLIYDWLLG